LVKLFDFVIEMELAYEKYDFAEVYNIAK